MAALLSGCVSLVASLSSHCSVTLVLSKFLFLLCALNVSLTFISRVELAQPGSALSADKLLQAENQEANQQPSLLLWEVRESAWVQSLASPAVGPSSPW